MGEVKLRVCAADGVETRLACASCGEPICLRCQVETPDGLVCARCATREGRNARQRVTRSIAAVVAGIVLVAVAAAVFVAAVSRAHHQSSAVGRWESVADLSVLRGAASAVELRDGRVVVAGGGIGSIPLAGTEVYDPAGRRWTRAGDLPEARRGSGMALLGDGRVLIAGGLAGDEVLSSAAVFDPSAGSWTETAPMAAARFGETLTSLADGRVLAAGGIGADGRSLGSAEVFDPARGVWTPVPTGMATPRSGAAAVAMSDARVLVVGGVDTAHGESRVLASAELFDPVADVFTATGSLHDARQDLSATRLRDGRVLVAGGANASASLSSAEVFDPAVGTWARTASMAGGRRLHGASLLSDGNVLVTGGEAVREGARSALTTAEIYVASSGSWRPAGAMTCPRSAAAQVTLLDGTVLVAGGDAALPGQPPQAQSCSELFVPAA